ncbi:MAG: EAL domain-containing protein [Solirubrobacterales bacterium]|nr:EAL domain-containing protein [Solirubrobacterales bacterium]
MQRSAATVLSLADLAARKAGEIRLVRATGETVRAAVSLLRSADGAPQRFIDQLESFAARRQLQKHLRRWVDEDPLTGRWNRRRFQEETERALVQAATEGTPGALLALDLEHFGEVNDIYGHEVGDDPLRDVGDALQSCLHGGDALARTGGDEFAILLEDVAPDEAVAVSAKVAAAVGGVVAAKGGAQRRMSACVGLAFFGAARETAGRLMATADLAMYEAKWALSTGAGAAARRGLGAVTARPLPVPVDSDLSGVDLRWLSRIRWAIDEDRFVLFAQPIVEIATGDVIQHELLIRMLGQDGELIAPGSFLPTAERYGLVAEIDHWGIARAARFAECGHAVAVNLSGDSLADPDLGARVERELRLTGADPTLLALEITETALARDQGVAVSFVSRMRSLGCSVALDDFGTGYAGFSNLKRLPVDVLKIDREFVADLLVNPASEQVVRAVVQLAQGLGLSTVAEGVEEAAILERLGALEVDSAQGFHLGRPAAADGILNAARQAVGARLP